MKFMQLSIFPNFYILFTISSIFSTYKKLYLKIYQKKNQKTKKLFYNTILNGSHPVSSLLRSSG